MIYKNYWKNSKDEREGNGSVTLAIFADLSVEGSSEGELFSVTSLFSWTSSNTGERYRDGGAKVDVSP